MVQGYTTTYSDRISGKVESVIVKQEGNGRNIRFNCVLDSDDDKLAFVQVGLAGKPMVIANVTNNSHSLKTNNGVARFTIDFLLSADEALPKELFVIAQKSDGSCYPIKMDVSSEIIEFEKVPECPRIVVESVTRRIDVEYRAFIDRGVGVAVPQNQKPEWSIIFSQGEPANIFASLRSIESVVLNRAEVFVPEDGGNGDLLANLRGVRRYKITDGAISGLNQAILDAHGKYILIIDPRASLLAGGVDIASDVFAKSEEVAAVVGRVLRPDGILHEAGLVLGTNGEVSCFGSGHQANGWEYLYEHDVDVASPVVSFFRKSAFSDLSFDISSPNFLSAYTKLSLNLRHLGNTIVYHPDIMASLCVADLNQTLSIPEIASNGEADSEFNADDDPNDVYYQGEVAEEYREVKSVFPQIVKSSANKAGALVVLGHLTEDVIGESRIHNIFETLSKDGFAVTIYAMRGIECTPAQLRRDLPMTVQYVDGCETPLQEFLEQNVDVYDLAVVWQLPHLRKVLETVAKYKMPVICDVSGREVFSDSERALLHKTSAVWVEDEKEVHRLRTVGIYHAEVISFINGCDGAECIAALLPKMRSLIASQEVE